MAVSFRNFWHKLFHWEYWPSYVFNIPVVCFWLWFALRARSLFFFAATNPAIETGGVLGESKIDIMNQVPEAYCPTTVFIPTHTSWETAWAKVKAAQIQFPCIGKPNIGERGFLVTKLADSTALKDYLTQHGKNRDLIVQAYIDYPMEVSVLHWRMPDAETGTITSVCEKVHLTVTGDGQHSLAQLIQQYPRARFQEAQLRSLWSEEALRSILKKDEKVVLSSIGNHSRGATFLNANDQIDDLLHQVFDSLSHQLHGILFARFDIKCASWESLKAGKEMAILEINGVAAEPAHIYDPHYKLRHAYRDMWQQWNTIFRLSQAQHARGIPYMTWAEARSAWRKHRASMR